MAGFSRPYSGMGGGALPAGYAEMITSPGRSMAAGMMMAGEGIARGMEDMKRVKAEDALANAVRNAIKEQAERNRNPMMERPKEERFLGYTDDEWDLAGAEKRRAAVEAARIASDMEERRLKAVAERLREKAEQEKHKAEQEKLERERSGAISIKGAVSDYDSIKNPAVPKQTIRGKMGLQEPIVLPELPEERFTWPEAMKRNPGIANADPAMVNAITRAIEEQRARKDLLPFGASDVVDLGKVTGDPRLSGRYVSRQTPTTWTQPFSGGMEASQSPQIPAPEGMEVAEATWTPKGWQAKFKIKPGEQPNLVKTKAHGVWYDPERGTYLKETPQGMFEQYLGEVASEAETKTTPKPVSAATKNKASSNVTKQWELDDQGNLKLLE